MPDKENKPIRPNRWGFDSTAEFKAQIEAQAAFRGFDSVKGYLISLIDKDRETIALIDKAEKKPSRK